MNKVDKLRELAECSEDFVISSIFNHTVEVYNIFRPTTNLYSKFIEHVNKNKQIKIDHVFNFHLKFYIPKLWFIGCHPPVKHLVIMINGLNEIYDKHVKLYDQIGHSLTYRGIASVLLPTPFHLNRSLYKKREGEYPKVSPPSEALKNKRISANAFYTNFQQTIYEIDELINHVHLKISPNEQKIEECFYKLIFGENTTISLFGYSLGGLRALASFLKQPDSFLKCFILNSGGTLSDLNHKIVGEKEDWHKIREYIKQGLEKTKRNNLPDYELLESIFFEPAISGGNFDPMKDRSRLVFFHGAKDNVMAPNTVQRLVPRDTSTGGMNILQVSNLGHFPLEDAEWNTWFPTIIEIINNHLQFSFSTGTNKEVVLAKLFLLHKDLDYQLLNPIGKIKFENILKNWRESPKLSKILELYLMVRFFYESDEINKAVLEFSEKHILFFGQVAKKLYIATHTDINNALKTKENNNNDKIGKLIFRRAGRNTNINKVLENQQINYTKLNQLIDTLG